MNPNMVILSHPTYTVPISGSIVGAATYPFMTKGYKPPSQDRALEVDVVINQNGRFKYVYDNGPVFFAWAPFTVVCEQKFTAIVGATAGAQYSRIREMWDSPGLLEMQTPEGTYIVHWASNPIEQAFRVFPIKSGDAPEWEVTVQFEAAT